MEFKEQGNLKGNVNHAVCRWCYGDMPMEFFFERVRDFGIKGIDLLRPEEWDVAHKHGLECSLATDNFAQIESGFNTNDNHLELVSKYKGLIQNASEHGIKQVIVFSGNRNGLSDDEGMENCAVGLEPLVKYAESMDVTLVMELLNSKLDHEDYQCDHTAWGVSLVDRIGSPNFKLLYDIYHMQIMEGDIIATILKYHDYFSHYHTGGVPGRNEINASQELNYGIIAKAIKETGFKGYVAQEFIPTTQKKLDALFEGVRICDV